MSLNWMIDSPTLYVTSPTVTTPLRRPSQELFANSSTPIDSVVPRTPSINNNQYLIDQCVPHTPAALSIAISPVNTISSPGTPLNHLNTTSPSRYSILYFDNQDDNTANASSIDSANATSADQTVPSTPSNVCEPYVHVSGGDNSSQSSSMNRNCDSCVGDPLPSSSTVVESNIVTKHLKSTARKLSLRKSNNTFAHINTIHQTLPSKKASATQGSFSNSNRTATLSIPENSPRPTKKTCNTTSGRVATPLDNSPPSQTINEPAATTSTCSPRTLPSNSLATITASTSPAPDVSAIHTREIRHVLRQSTDMGEVRHLQGRHEAIPNNYTQLQLFDDDDIF